ncbi:MAG: thioredoxin domain-containing protein [Eubacterium sp.]
MKICKLNVDENTELARQYRVMSIPTCVFLNQGEEVERFVGTREKQAYIETLTNI